MWTKGQLEARWEKLATEVYIGFREWRLQHSKATFREIERALDERWAKARARMLEDAALASAAADLSEASEEERPSCPRCGQRMEAHGRDTRNLTTSYNETISLERSYAHCPNCGSGLFPPG